LSILPLAPHMVQSLQSLQINSAGQNHIYTVYIRYFWLGNHQIYGVYIRIYTVLANATDKAISRNVQLLGCVCKTCKIVILIVVASHMVRTYDMSTHEGLARTLHLQVYTVYIRYF